ncbi:MAG: efflux transporter outer membrane subunit [Magnetococcales bacterium]|nr:efflux transporter outer membrane subunit [Magnetococcales bacterium]
MHKLVLRTLPTVALLLAGCSFMPVYERPVAPIATEWPEGARAEGRQTMVGLSWRQMLPDPGLRILIELALEHNRDWHAAIARVEEARALHGITHADRLPGVSLNASQAALLTPADFFPAARAQTSKRYDVAASVTAFELDFWGRVKSLDTAARAGFLATEQAREAFRLVLIADVASAFFTRQEAHEQLLLARATLDNRHNFLTLMQKRNEAGLANELDVRVAEAAYAAVRAQIAALEQSRAQAENALVLLVGQPVPDLPAGRRLAEQNQPLDLAVALPSAVLTNRPDVCAAEGRLIAANANIGVARAAFLPRISLSLAFGTASNTFSGLFASGSGAWNFAPNLTQPLFDAGRNQAGVDLAEARKVVAVAEYEKAIQLAFREVADLLVARDRLAEQLRAQEDAERFQEDRLRLVEARSLSGAINHLDVLDAQRETFAVAQDTIRIRKALLSTAAQLYKALGGGDERRTENLSSL